MTACRTTPRHKSSPEAGLPSTTPNYGPRSFVCNFNGKGSLSCHGFLCPRLWQRPNHNRCNTHRMAVAVASSPSMLTPTLWLRPSSVRSLADDGALASATLTLVTYAWLCVSWCSFIVAASMYCAAVHKRQEASQCQQCPRQLTMTGDLVRTVAGALAV